MNRREFVVRMGLALGLLAACRRSAAQEEKQEEGQSAASATRLVIASDDNQMAFDQTRLTAPAGRQVTLTFRNRSTIFQHNWVLVNGGAEVAESVYGRAVAAGPARGYVPEDEPAVLAATKLVDSGDEETITFVTPAAGEYVYLCTFPGHYLAGMKGVLEVTAR